MKRQGWFWVFGGLTLCCMVLIYIMSAQDAQTSAMTSGGITQWLARFFYGPYTELTKELLQPVSILVRKTGHMAAYAVLFLLSYGTVHFYKDFPVKIKWLLAYGWAVLYAITDEIHQIFSGRGATVVDVVIDAFGALIGTVLLFGIGTFLRTHNKWRKVGWAFATLAGAFGIYVLTFLLFHREVIGLFF